MSDVSLPHYLKDGYLPLRDHLLARHVDVRFDYAHCQSRRFPDSPEGFVFEFAWALLTATRHRAEARPIMDRLAPVLKSGGSLFDQCEPEEAARIEAIRIDRKKRYATARALVSRDDGPTALVSFLQTLPGMSGATGYRLARNLGADVAVPDASLTALAEPLAKPVQGLCEYVADGTGDRSASVGLILSRAIEYGLLLPTAQGPVVAVQEHQAGDLDGRRSVLLGARRGDRP